MKNIWLWGPPGVGKSRSVRITHPNAYFKACNKWWDGYQGEENVIIDDFELDHKCLGHYLKIWGDRYSFVAESKGGAMHIRPKAIVVTSNYSIESVFASDQEMVKAVLRRFDQRNIYQPLEFPEEVAEAATETALEDDAAEELDFSIWDDDCLEH